MGATLREIIFDIGGGIKNDEEFKAVQIGGPSGGCLTFGKDQLDFTLDFDSLKKAFDEAQPEIVLHLAAQPIVRDSYKNACIYI